MFIDQFRGQKKASFLKIAKKKGLWDNIHAKRERGEAPAKPGDKDYPSDKDLKDSQTKESAEKLACWADIGDKLKVTAGEHEGYTGMVVEIDDDDKTEEYIDDDGAAVRKTKRKKTFKLRKEGDTEGGVTVEDCHCDRVYEDSDAPVEAKCGSDKQAAEKLADCYFYGSVGEHYKFCCGDHEGKKGVLTRCDEHRKRNEYLDDDGATVKKTKNTYTCKVKLEDGETITTDKPHVELKRYWPEDEKNAAEKNAYDDATVAAIQRGEDRIATGADAIEATNKYVQPAYLTDSQKFAGGKLAEFYRNVGLEKQAGEKLAELSFRVINGDVGLEQIQEVFAKEADTPAEDTKDI